jgi:hypothetical protein
MDMPQPYMSEQLDDLLIFLTLLIIICIFFGLFLTLHMLITSMIYWTQRRLKYFLM